MLCEFICIGVHLMQQMNQGSLGRLRVRMMFQKLDFIQKNIFQVEYFLYYMELHFFKFNMTCKFFVKECTTTTQEEKEFLFPMFTAT